jgi:hypothetical protein
MLPTATSTVMQATTACGACVDMNLMGLAPFLGWWLLLFVAWSLLVGPLVFRFVNAANATDLRNPARLFLWLFGLLVASVLITGGSVMLPFVLLAPFWIGALVSGIRCECTGWRKFCIMVVGMMVLLVPVSYLMPGAKRSSGHGVRTTSGPGAPAKSGTVPTAPPAPTLQEALPAKQPKP